MRIRAGIAVAAIAIGATACGGWQAEAKRRALPTPGSTVRAFLDFDYVREVYGIDPLTSEQSAGRWHWELDFVGEVARAARHVSPSGAVHQRRAFDRAADGSLRVRVFDSYGVQKATVTVASSGLFKRVATSGFTGNHGCFVEALEGDAMGRVVGRKCFDSSMRPTADEAGCHARRFTLNDRAHVVRTECLDADGRASTFAGENAVSETQVDDLGHDVRVDYRMADGRPKPSGCASLDRTFDDRGDVVAQTCRSAAGDVLWTNEIAYDAAGCRSEAWNVGPAGNRILLDGVAGIRLRNDEHCGTLEEWRLDVAGAPVGPRRHQRYVRDERGRTTREECFDADGEPRPCFEVSESAKFASVVENDYDDRDRLVRQRCLSPRGEPRSCGNRKSSVGVFEYDENGLLASERYEDDRGRAARSLGAAEIRTEHDFAGRELRRRFFDADGNPVASSMGCHEVAYARDDHHRVVEITCNGVGGALSSATACIDLVCWPNSAARVAIVRLPDGKRQNAFYDVHGTELEVRACDVNRCHP